MAEELASYRDQLQQVLVALKEDPGNEELQKLEVDLREVINITSSLVALPEEGAAPASGGGSIWNVDDECQAVWSKDGKYYRAKVVEVKETTATVAFEGYDETETVNIKSLKRPAGFVEGSKKRSAATMGGGQAGPVNPTAKSATTKEEERLRKKRRSEKKKKRFEEYDEKIKKDINSWKNFNTKASKKSKGITKKSIFASPDSVDGKVGVGTCGLGGKGMTAYQQRGEWQHDEKRKLTSLNKSKAF